MIINKISKFNSNVQLGDNYLDRIVSLNINNITHKIWLATSDLFRITYKLNDNNIDEFYSEKLKENIFRDQTWESWLENQMTCTINGLRLVAGKKENILNNICYYEIFPRVIFTTNKI